MPYYKTHKVSAHTVLSVNLSKRVCTYILMYMDNFSDEYKAQQSLKYTLHVV